MAESCFHKSLKKLQDFFMLKTIINYYKKKKKGTRLGMYKNIPRITTYLL